MQDMIKQWPILSLLPMCTTDAGPSIINMIVCMSEVFGMIQGGVWYFHFALNIPFLVDYPINLLVLKKWR